MSFCFFVDQLKFICSWSTLYRMNMLTSQGYNLYFCIVCNALHILTSNWRYTTRKSWKRMEARFGKGALILLQAQNGLRNSAMKWFCAGPKAVHHRLLWFPILNPNDSGFFHDWIVRRALVVTDGQCSRMHVFALVTLVTGSSWHHTKVIVGMLFVDVCRRKSWVCTSSVRHIISIMFGWMG